jgi:hypothetical protein
MIVRKATLGAIFIVFCAGTVSAGGLGKAFSEASQALTRSQSAKVFNFRPSANAQPPVVLRLDNGNARVSTFSAPRDNGTGKWYQKDVDQSGNTVQDSFQKWSP